MRLPLVALILLLLPAASARAVEDQPTALPAHLASVHPRISARTGLTQAEMRAFVAHNEEAQKTVARARAELAPDLDHVRQDPMWVASRLQMYWKSHATDVYNRGDVFDHAEGHAPVATVRFPGSRNPTSVYRAPQLEDIPPYEDDTRGVWLVNSAAPGQPLEWAPPSKSGRVVDGINASMMRRAENAAELAWLTGDEEYARFAFTIFDTYMRGMNARKEPVDLNHGHSQTIYGMSTFEVIQESNILPPLATTYDFLYDYIARHHPDALPLYADTFRQWIDVTLHNGVPFNNWDLFEDNIAASVAFVLEDDSAYGDGRGAEHYLDQILHQDSIRHWSLRKLAAEGFDSRTGIWFEAPGYSMTVVSDFVTLINRIDRVAGTDLLAEMPVVRKAAASMAQYAFPNGITVAWGDSHYAPISTAAAWAMVENARMHHRRDDEVYFTGLIKLFDKLNGERAPAAASPRGSGLEALFERERATLDPSLQPLRAEQVFTPSFSAPSVSYLVQRNGLDPESGLMIAEAGSLGNHQHANGITMELFGQGLPLAPDSGIGTNYFESDHNEYYAQFPAHNTVVVDGISSYPTMLSHHGFTVNAAYPAPGEQARTALPATFSDVSFLEPETNADQRRVMGTIRLSADHGYYIDIFRSHRRDGHDRTHDYFLHGLGQQLEIEAGDGSKLPLAPSDKLTFAEGALGAYDYLWDKRLVGSAAMYHARYSLEMPDRKVQLHAWMAGAEGRQMFQVLAPPARSLRDTVPAAIGALPLHTMVLRQAGEAWNRPFVAVYEPVQTATGAAIRQVRMLALAKAPEGAVAVRVEQDGGRQQTILSAANEKDVVEAGELACQGSYGVADVGPHEESLLLGHGAWIATRDLRVEVEGGSGSAYVQRQDAHLLLAFSAPGELRILAEKSLSRLQLGARAIAGRKVRDGEHEWMVFAIPATEATEATLYDERPARP